MKNYKRPHSNLREFEQVYWQWFETPLGKMLAKWINQNLKANANNTPVEDLYLAGLWFEDQKYFPLGAPKNTTWTDMPEIFLVLEQGLLSYFNGDAKAWDLLCTIPLKPEGSDFQIKVWDLLLDVPYGQTRTYGQLAKEIAMAQNKTSFSAQAVGGAVGRNPISILIPCHRIVGAQGALTGYAGGVDKKFRLLHLENAMSIQPYSCNQD